jgi:arylsulfatase A-like enzyme
VGPVTPPHRTNRREFLRGAGAAAAATMLPGAVRAASPKRPNILLLIADDWSFPHAGVLGDPVVRTPTFDRIAREGVLFRNAFTPAPSCTPSRAVMATGQYHWRLESAASLGGSLPGDVPTYPDLLQADRYFVGFSGKDIAPGSNVHRPTSPCGKRFRNFEEFAKARPPRTPFAYWLGSGDPHRPYKSGEGVAAGMEAKRVRVPACLPDTSVVRADICDYYARIQRFDARCGQILKHLEDSGELDNTLVVMTSDNGMPFPRCKATLYDDGTRMPLAVRWPAAVKGGRTVDDFVSLCDLAPTFLEAVGVDVPREVTGKSLLGILRSGKGGQVDPKRTFALRGMERHCYSYPSRAIRTGEYLYIRNFDPGAWRTGEGQWPSEARDFSYNIDPSPSKRYMMAHRGDAKVKGLYEKAFGRRAEEELYDLRTDPGQLHNVAGQAAQAETKRKLAALLKQKLIDSGDLRMAGQGDRYERYRTRDRKKRT